MSLFAQVIVDISQEAVDRPFTYLVPDGLKDQVFLGAVARIPFGKANRLRSGYIISLTDSCALPPEKIKCISEIRTGEETTDGRLIALAAWMRDTYGSTMYQALKTVLPVREKTDVKKSRRVVRAVPVSELEEALGTMNPARNKARVRLLKALIREEALDCTKAARDLGLNRELLDFLTEKGFAKVETGETCPDPGAPFCRDQDGKQPADADAGRMDLTPVQHHALEEILEEFGYASRVPDGPEGFRNPAHTEPAGRPVLLKGVTGSGKTLLYLELIRRTLETGREAIVLIPEIALTYQTVQRFKACFGEKVAVINSRLSRGERYDQFRRARNREVSVMIGPRSALFTPFARLGLIIIDEEHETTYKSEQSPRYHARETAIRRAAMEGACVLMGSATPSLEAYRNARTGRFRLVTLDERFGDSMLPEVEIVDMRKEFRSGNRSILSRRLAAELSQCLDQGGQAMLFLNRRGYAAFVSCRSCGEVIRCPHCDVALSEHNGGRMICHYCGYERQLPGCCPSCGSPHIGGFKAGTQQVETAVRAILPKARVLRMDFDTTRRKGSYEQILSSFARHEADILVGTQMIVKGHDFPDVILMGALAADLSLGSSDFRGAERTYQLLAQAAGRAGRGERPGKALFQTYQPDHYSILAAARQDYDAFYQEEMGYRELLGYPPAACLMAVLGASPEEDRLDKAMRGIRLCIGRLRPPESLHVIGPAPAAVGKIRDIYYKVIYLKHPDPAALEAIRDRLDRYIALNTGFEGVTIQYDVQW